MDSSTFGRLLIVIGLAAVAAGVLVRTGALGWFGNLPGDIRIVTGRTRVFFPITSMVIVSVVVSLVAALLRR